jgi:hypothetical protein
VSLVVFSIVITGGIGVFYRIYRDWTKQRNYVNCLQSAYWALEFMAMEFRQATSTNVTTASPAITRVRLQTPQSGNDYIWYWRGNQDSQHEDSSFGYLGYLYRAQTSNAAFNPSQDDEKAYNNRRVLAQYIADNENGNFFYTENNGLITLELTLRPDPEHNPGPGNRNYNVITRVRRRN